MPLLTLEKSLNLSTFPSLSLSLPLFPCRSLLAWQQNIHTKHLSLRPVPFLCTIFILHFRFRLTQLLYMFVYFNFVLGWLIFFDYYSLRFRFAFMLLLFCFHFRLNLILSSTYLATRLKIFCLYLLQCRSHIHSNTIKMRLLHVCRYLFISTFDGKQNLLALKPESDQDSMSSVWHISWQILSVLLILIPWQLGIPSRHKW